MFRITISQFGIMFLVLVNETQGGVVNSPQMGLRLRIAKLKKVLNERNEKANIYENIFIF